MNATVGNRIEALIKAGDMSKEADVNGVWNSVLALYFPTDQMQFVIAPEASPGDSSRTDLLVRSYAYGGSGGNLKVDNSFTVILFEGKSNTGDHFDQIRSQLAGYLKSLKVDACWAIGARGTQVKFWRYIKDRMADEMRPWTVEKNGQPKEVDRDSKDSYVFQITEWNDPDVTKSFVPIMNHIKAHPNAKNA